MTKEELIRELDNPANFTKQGLDIFRVGAKGGPISAFFISALSQTEIALKEQPSQGGFVRISSANMTLDQVKNRLVRIYDDPSFDFNRYLSPDKCRSMCANGPNAPSIDDINIQQWKMIEMLISDHDGHRRKRA